MSIYIKRTPRGYYVCCSGLAVREMNVWPYASIVPAMERAKEAAKRYRTYQKVIRVYDC